MAKNNSSNQDFTNNADGFDLTGGTTRRKLTATGADITLTGSGTNVYSFPAATDTLVGRASTDTLTNKTFDTAGTGNVLKINGTQVTDVSGTGKNVLDTSPTITTPVINFKASQLTIQDDTDATKIGKFIASGINTGTTASYTLPNATQSIVGTSATQTLTNKTLTSPTLTTPALGVATATSINKVAVTAPATSATLTIPDGVTLTGPASSGTAMTLGNTETVTGAKTFGAAGNVGKLIIAGTTSGTTILNATATASGTLTLPAATDTLVGKATTDVFTNKDLTSTTNTFPNGSLVQVVNANFSAAATGTTLIPEDDTIPQITEGDQYMTLAITPKSTTNRLVIRCVAMVSQSTSTNDVIGALFQDATASALAAKDASFPTGAGAMVTLTVEHEMAAGTTSATTFRLRAGLAAVGTLTFNGFGGVRKFGGITLSSMTIWEYKA